MQSYFWYGNAANRTTRIRITNNVIDIEVTLIFANIESRSSHLRGRRCEIVPLLPIANETIYNDREANEFSVQNGIIVFLDASTLPRTIFSMIKTRIF